MLPRQAPVVTLLLAAVLAGCGSSPYKSYRDSRYHFTLQYPSGWSGPSITQGTADGVPSHIVSFTAAGSSVQIRVVVNRSRPDFSSIPNGRVVPQGSDTLYYFRRTVAGHSALLILDRHGNTFQREFAYVNTARYGYDLEMLAATRINKADQRNYLHLLHTFRFGKGG